MPASTEPKMTLPKAFLTTLVALFVSVLAIAASQDIAVADVDNINNNNREDVARSYLAAIEGGRNVQHEWSGSVENCAAGQVSPEFHTATLNAVNWFREMAGLDHVVDNAAANQRAQAGALMMHAENSLSHSPSASWSCFTGAGAETASRANLTLGLVGIDGIDGQMEDAGAHNLALGHRRWLLYPSLSEVGVGSTSRAGVVEVIGHFGDGGSESPWVAWPPPGFAPHDVVFDRWSISRPGADFSRASVSVTRNGSAVPVTLLPISNGYGDPSLGWEIPGTGQTTSDVTYEVRVSNVVHGDRTLDFSYTVTAFDPTKTAAGTCNGLPGTIFGTDIGDRLVGTEGNDVIIAFGGRDEINGLGGNDTICGGNGRDTISGGDGNDVISGGDGNDGIYGNAGADTVKGNAGSDTLVGGKGNDTLVGGKGNDDISGSLGVDTLSGDDGADDCWGNSSQESSAPNDARRSCEAGR